MSDTKKRRNTVDSGDASISSSHSKDENKDKKFRTQLQKVYQSFFDKPKTMKEVDRETAVMRESICRYCRALRLSNQLFAVGKRYCAVTQHMAITWSTNPDFTPKTNQLSMEGGMKWE